MKFQNVLVLSLAMCQGVLSLEKLRDEGVFKQINGKNFKCFDTEKQAIAFRNTLGLRRSGSGTAIPPLQRNTENARRGKGFDDAPKSTISDGFNGQNSRVSGATRNAEDEIEGNQSKEKSERVTKKMEPKDKVSANPLSRTTLENYLEFPSSRDSGEIAGNF